jgi:hypothetical protein
MSLAGYVTPSDPLSFTFLTLVQNDPKYEKAGQNEGCSISTSLE